jgi:hypothetical protein
MMAEYRTRRIGSDIEMTPTALQLKVQADFDRARMANEQRYQAIRASGQQNGRIGGTGRLGQQSMRGFSNAQRDMQAYIAERDGDELLTAMRSANIVIKEEQEGSCDGDMIIPPKLIIEALEVKKPRAVSKIQNGAADKYYNMDEKKRWFQFWK